MIKSFTISLDKIVHNFSRSMIDFLINISLEKNTKLLTNSSEAFHTDLQNLLLTPGNTFRKLCKNAMSPMLLGEELIDKMRECYDNNEKFVLILNDSKSNTITALAYTEINW